MRKIVSRITKLPPSGTWGLIECQIHEAYSNNLLFSHTGIPDKDGHIFKHRWWQREVKKPVGRYSILMAVKLLIEHFKVGAVVVAACYIIVQLPELLVFLFITRLHLYMQSINLHHTNGEKYYVQYIWKQSCRTHKIIIFLCKCIY